MAWELLRDKTALTDDTDHLGAGSLPADADRRPGPARRRAAKMLLTGMWVDGNGDEVSGSGTATIRPLAVMDLEGVESLRALADAVASWDPREVLELAIPPMAKGDELYVRLTSLTGPGGATGIRIYGRPIEL